MKAKQIALSREQMQRLQELGVDTSNASMCWLKFSNDNVDYEELVVHDENCYESSNSNPAPAFTLQDVIEMLPSELPYQGVLTFRKATNEEDYGKWVAEYDDSSCRRISNYNLIEAANELLILCAENGYVNQILQTNDKIRT